MREGVNCRSKPCSLLDGTLVLCIIMMDIYIYFITKLLLIRIIVYTNTHTHLSHL